MVVIQNSIQKPSINEDTLINQLQQVINDLGKGDSELLIRMVEPHEIQHLNKTYRHQDKPTNVLAFPSDLPIEIDEAILGDVVICLAVVEQEAQAQQKPFLNHLTHIAIHGTLHLLGYDHIEDNQAKIMENLEINILNRLHIKNPY